MAVKDVADATLCNVPDANLLILGASGEELAVRGEADGADIEVAGFSSRVVGEDAIILCIRSLASSKPITAKNEPCLLASLCVVDLGCAIATSRKELTVC